MHRHIDGWHSPTLNMYMDIATYGYYGFPLLLFPTAAADFLEYERFQLIHTLREFIEAGKVKVFSINSINQRGWLNPEEHPRYKALWQVHYNKYLVDEVVPYIWDSVQGEIGIITAGASLGAFHSLNQTLRRPDIFDGVIAMSGIYDIRRFMHSDYYDDNVYYNNPVDYIPGLEGAYLELLQKKQHIHIVTGQGAHENPDASQRISTLLGQKGIPHNLDVWGHDMPHDWHTWRTMMWHYLAEKF